MNNIYFDILDQIRFMGGTLAAVILFTINTVNKREKFLFKSILSFIGCLFISLGILIIKGYVNRSIFISIPIYSIWYLLMTFLPIAYIIFCFEINICNAIFRCILGVVSQQIITIIFKQWLIGIIYPDFQKNNPITYTILLIVIYIIGLYIIYKCLAKRINKDSTLTVLEDKTTFINNILMILIFTFIFNLSSVILEIILPKFNKYIELMVVTSFLKYFILLFELMFSVIIFIIHFSIYKNKKLQSEKELLIRMNVEKRKQYKLARENIDFIKQKAHDLKHYILALEVVNEKERKKVIREIKKEVMIYDGIIKTDSEVLNIILTEKNLYCINNNIKLSNTIYTTDVEFIDVIDLYSIIGNALDNSIECVRRFEDKDKKTISFSINKVGQMLFITSENYYNNKIIMQDGLPITSKTDKSYHGLGLKNIKMLVKKYNGHIRIDTEDNIFTLQILIPIPEL